MADPRQRVAPLVHVRHEHIGAVAVLTAVRLVLVRDRCLGRGSRSRRTIDGTGAAAAPASVLVGQLLVHRVHVEVEVLAVDELVVGIENTAPGATNLEAVGLR